MENQAEYKGWAKIEVMGHQSHIGYVTTEVYGAAVLFRIDRPGIPEVEETLLRPEWIGDQHCAIGSVIKRAAVEPLSVLVGAGSIYRIIPCSEEVAIAAIQKEQRRPLAIVKLAEVKRIESVERQYETDFDDPQDFTEETQEGLYR